MMESNRKQLDAHALEYLHDRVKSGKRISKEPGKKDRLINGGRAMRALRNTTEEYSKYSFILSYMKHYISQDQNLNQHTWTPGSMLEGFNIIIDANMLEAGVLEKIETLFTRHIEQFTDEVDVIWTKYLLPPLTEYTNKTAKDNPDEVLKKRISNVKSLFENLRTNCLRKGSSLSEGIDDLVMLAESETKLEENAIQLLTIHASKGLEFPHTFIIGVEEESFFRTSEPTDEDIESELCTLFVALTRGEESVTMTQTDTRFVNGQWLDRKPLSLLLDSKEALDALDMDKYNSIEQETVNSDINRLFNLHGQ
jgi:superfamily I DNA/RNA helicase